MERFSTHCRELDLPSRCFGALPFIHLWSPDSRYLLGFYLRMIDVFDMLPHGHLYILCSLLIMYSMLIWNPFNATSRKGPFFGKSFHDVNDIRSDLIPRPSQGKHENVEGD